MAAHEEEAGGCGEDGSGPNRACEVKAAQDRRRTADLSCSLMSLEQVGAGRSPPEVRLKSAFYQRLLVFLCFFLLIFKMFVSRQKLRTRRLIWIRACLMLRSGPNQ